MAIAYPVASSSNVYYPSSSTTSSTYHHSTTSSSSVVYNPVTPIKSYSSTGYYDYDDEYYTSSVSANKGVLTKSSTKYTTICKTETVSGKPVTYTTVYDLLNSCYPTVTVTKTVTQAKATPVAGIATTLPYKPVQSEYAQYGELFISSPSQSRQSMIRLSKFLAITIRILKLPGILRARSRVAIPLSKCASFVAHDRKRT